MARTTVTRYCSHRCNQSDYKLKEKKKKIQQSRKETKQKMLQEMQTANSAPLSGKEFINIKELAIVSGISESTLFRIIKDENFPKIKIRRRLIFNKHDVINYFTNKYGIL